MKRLDIRLAAQYSGIKAHTIRIWEQRYELLTPQKRAGNRREYTQKDIIDLMDIALLTKYGYAISKLARFNREKINDIIMQLSSSAAGTDISINKLLKHFLQTHIFHFENTINDFAAKKGLHATVKELIVPFIERAELFSFTDQNTSTHYAANIIRNKIIAATEQLEKNETKEETVILFLPPGQYFELILLYLSYQLQRNGYRVIYAGCNTSFTTIAEIISTHTINGLVTYISPREKTNIHALQEFASNQLRGGHLFIAHADNFSSIDSIKFDSTRSYQSIAQ